MDIAVKRRGVKGGLLAGFVRFHGGSSQCAWARRKYKSSRDRGDFRNPTNGYGAGGIASLVGASEQMRSGVDQMGMYIAMDVEILSDFGIISVSA